MPEPRSLLSTNLLDEASVWFMRLRAPDCSEADRAAFAAWLGHGHDRREAYAETERLWRDLQGLRETAGARLEAARAQTHRPRRILRYRVHALGFAAAAAVLLAIAPGLWPHGETYRTGRGERLHVELADGSSIDLNARTELTIRPGQRRVQLIQGEAFFSVTHDERAPFEVSSTGGSIHDVGTRFGVRIQNGRTVVAVVEGEVLVETSLHGQTVNLLPGLQAAFDSSGRLSAPAPVDTEALVAWVNGKLLFRSRPLGEVLEQLSDTHGVELRLAQSRWANQPVTGSFPIDDLRLALDTIAVALNLKVQQLDAMHWALSPPTNPP